MRNESYSMQAGRRLNPHHCHVFETIPDVDSKLFLLVLTPFIGYCFGISLIGVSAMKLFTVHDKEQDKTWLMGYYDTLEFLMRNKLDEEKSSFDFIFDVENYGPRTLAKRFLVTQHTAESYR